MPHSSSVEPCGARLGFCRWCGRPVYPVSFDSPAAAREYLISSLCPVCQDAMFLGGTDGDPYLAGAVRRGAVFAAALDVQADAPSEATILPFRYNSRDGRVLWSPAELIWAGTGEVPAHPWSQLGAIRPVWAAAECYERFLALPTLEDPYLQSQLSSHDLLISLDCATAAVARQICPSSAVVALTAAVPWSEAFGASLFPIDVFVASCGLDHALGREVGREPALRTSALRQAAFVARLLVLRSSEPHTAGRTAFELLLDVNASRSATPALEDSCGAPSA
ncbi:MAG: hypothetical protein OXU81_13635 [Gammaproteobacteria bacterium]|nr:hypothetical protein [Gammaproteobacteria bacterium]